MLKRACLSLVVASAIVVTAVFLSWNSEQLRWLSFVLTPAEWIIMRATSLPRGAVTGVIVATLFWSVVVFGANRRAFQGWPCGAPRRLTRPLHRTSTAALLPFEIYTSSRAVAAGERQTVRRTMAHFDDAILPSWLRVSALGLVGATVSLLVGVALQRVELTRSWWSITAHIVGGGLWAAGFGFTMLFTMTLLAGAAYWALRRRKRRYP